MIEEMVDMGKDDYTKVQNLDQVVVADAADYLNCFESFCKEIDDLYRFLKRENPAMGLMIEVRKTKQKLLDSLNKTYHRKLIFPYHKLK
jgi:hypothetical protein